MLNNNYYKVNFPDLDRDAEAGSCHSEFLLTHFAKSGCYLSLCLSQSITINKIGARFTRSAAP